MLRDEPRLLRGTNHWLSGDLDQRYPEPIEPVDYLASVLRDLPRSIFLETESGEVDRPPIHFDRAFHRDQGRPLKSSGVRAVDDDLPHEVNFVDWTHAEERGRLETDLNGPLVRGMRRF